METIEALQTRDVYNLIFFARQTCERVDQALLDLGGDSTLVDECQWLAQARAILHRTLDTLRDAQEEARFLPELRWFREQANQGFEQAWIDAIEELHGEIARRAGPRTPVLEALIVHNRFAQLRRSSFPGLEAYARELYRRSKSAYVERLLSMEEFAFVKPLLDQTRVKFEQILENRAECTLTTGEIEERSEALLCHGPGLERTITQARLLVQAALIPRPGEFERLGFNAKPKKAQPPLESSPEPTSAETYLPAGAT